MANLRFQLDENLPNAIAEALRNRGIEVRTAAEAGLIGEPDEAYLRLSVGEGWVIVTQDDDFLGHAKRGAAHAGILYYRQGARSIGEVISGIELIHAVLNADEMVGQVQYL